MNVFRSVGASSVYGAEVVILLPLALGLEGALLAGALSDLITAVITIVVAVRQVKWLNTRIEQQKAAQLREPSNS